jgi:hypothetical protein
MLGLERLTGKLRQFGREVRNTISPVPSPAFDAYVKTTSLGYNPAIPVKVEERQVVVPDFYGKGKGRISVVDLPSGDEAIYFLEIREGKCKLTNEGEFPSSSRR